MIGVFDSGFGGLTILEKFLRVLPQYDYVYLGDNARAPYGNKSQEVIFNYTKEATRFLFKQGCELIIIACNTASTKALRRIQQEYLPKYNEQKRVLGVVIPVAEVAVELSRYGRIGVIGTKATIKSKVYEIELKKLRPDLEIYQQACPLLVSLVEEGWIGKPETNMILKKYLRPLKVKKIDTLILGCTHYPFLVKDIKRIMGKNIKVVNSPQVVSLKLGDYLERHTEIEQKLKKDKKRTFYTTDDPVMFKQFGQKFLGSTVKDVKRVIF